VTPKAFGVTRSPWRPLPRERASGARTIFEELVGPARNGKIRVFAHQTREKTLKFREQLLLTQTSFVYLACFVG